MAVAAKAVGSLFRDGLKPLLEKRLKIIMTRSSDRLRAFGIASQDHERRQRTESSSAFIQLRSKGDADRPSKYTQEVVEQRRLRMQTFWNLLDSWLGLVLEPKDLTFLQITLRGIIVFIVSLVMVRCGGRRSLAQKSAFDLIVVVASVLARAINGSAPFFSTLGGSFLIVLLHRALAHLTSHWPAFAKLVKGSPVILIRHGAYDCQAMRSQMISLGDLEEDMPLEG